MSLTDVRKYFKDRALELKYTPHDSGFVTDNIPSTKINRAFHVNATQFNGQAQNQMDLVMSCPVTVRLHFKGAKNQDETIERATAEGEAYIDACLASENRLTQKKVKNVTLSGMFIEGYGLSNDHTVVARIEFNATIFKGIC